jgi:hypothetical protein
MVSEKKNKIKKKIKGWLEETNYNNLENKRMRKG